MKKNVWKKRVVDKDMIVWDNKKNGKDIYIEKFDRGWDFVFYEKGYGDESFIEHFRLKEQAIDRAREFMRKVI